MTPHIPWTTWARAATGGLMLSLGGVALVDSPQTWLLGVVAVLGGYGWLRGALHAAHEKGYRDSELDAMAHRIWRRP